MATSSPTRIDPATSIGAVSLTVADLDRAQRFYEHAIGLETRERDGSTVRLGAGEATLVELVGDPDAPPRPRGTTGLFHQAILVPGRLELARALRRVIDAGWRFTGASDHLVSEALYLNDPEGNGIEIYRDRARDEWSYDGGQLQMATLPLDLDGLVAELGGAAPDGSPMPQGTTIGHVHLNVSDLAAAEAFYADAVGFDVTVRGYPGALFVSAGGYHHHLGLNTWTGEGAQAPPAGARGLRWFDVVVPTSDEVTRVEERIRAAAAGAERTASAVVAPDPSGNRVRITADFTRT